MSGEYVVIGEFQMLPVESTGIINANFSKFYRKFSVHLNFKVA